MITAEQVRKKACELKEIQTKEQLKREEEQLNRIQEGIMKTLEKDADATTLIVINLYKNNSTKLKELGFSCVKEDKSFCNCRNYIVSWE